MKQNKEVVINDDEITFKEFFNILKIGYKIFRKNLTILFSIGVLGYAIGYYIAFSHKPIYLAESKFVLKENAPSGLSSSLGNLNALLGGSIGSSTERTIAVINSDKILGNVLLSKIIFSNKEDLVINHFIALENLTPKSYSDSLHSTVKFNFSDTVISKFTFYQRKVFKEALSSFRKIIATSFDKKTEIISLIVSHRNEEFSIVVNEAINIQLVYYFRSQASLNSNLNVVLLSKKVDSIQRELDIVRSKIARTTDQSLGIILNEDRVDLKSLSVKEQILLSMYGESQKNLEAFLFMQQSALNSTVINFLDTPFSPLTPTTKNKLFYSVLGFVLASIVSFMFILVRYWFKNIMSS